MNVILCQVYSSHISYIFDQLKFNYFLQWNEPNNSMFLKGASSCYSRANVKLNRLHSCITCLSFFFHWAVLLYWLASVLLSYATAFETDLFKTLPVLWDFETISEMLLPSSSAIVRCFIFLAIFPILFSFRFLWRFWQWFYVMKGIRCRNFSCM